jgi:hypothetical protein
MMCVAAVRSLTIVLLQLRGASSARAFVLTAPSERFGWSELLESGVLHLYARVWSRYDQ